MAADEGAALAAAAKHHARRAQQACRALVRHLAATEGAFDTHAAATLRTAGDARSFLAVIEAAIDEHGHVDVVLLTPTTIHSPQRGAKETAT